jgi:hypothetical protein
MRPYLITAKLMRPSNMKRFPTPGVVYKCIVAVCLLNHKYTVSILGSTFLYKSVSMSVKRNLKLKTIDVSTIPL